MPILINDNTARVQYTATAGQTVFIVPYEFFEVGDLKVYNGDTLLAYNVSPSSASQYSVTGAGVTGGGSITLGAPGATISSVITIVRDIPIKRLTDFPNAGPFNIQALNAELDKLTAVQQNLETDLDNRVLRLGDSDTPNTLSALPNKAARENKLLGFDIQGQPTAYDAASLATLVAYATAYADTFTGDGIDTTFTLSGNPAVIANLDVSINGVTQVPLTDYTLSGTTLTTTTAVPNGAVMLVKFKEGLPNSSGAAQDFALTPNGYTTAVNVQAGFDNLGSSAGTSKVGFIQAGTGAQARPAQAKLRETVSVKDFGAVGNGVADDTAAIQAALDYFTNATTPGQVNFPSGTYKCTAGLTVNAGYVSCVGQRAVLNFSTVGNIAAVTFVGGNLYSGEPYNQSDAVFSGFKLIGPSTLLGAGLYFNQSGSGSGPAHMIVRDCNITNFNNGITFFSNAYLITVEHCDIWGCYRCVYMPPGSTNAGENIRVNNCALFNSDEGFKCEEGATTFNFVGTSFDGLLTSVILTVGQANFTGCHFEYVTVANKALSISANCIVTCTGCFFLNTFASQDKYIDNAGFLSIYGGRISVADTATNVVYSTSRLTMLGCHIQSTTTTPVTVASGNSLVYLPNTGVLRNSSTIAGSSVAATDGTFVGGKTITLSTLNTWVSLGVGTSNGLFTFRDGTSNGTAVFAADVGAQTSIQNNITGFEMNYGGVAGQMSVRVTSGTTPRSINFSLLQTGV